MAMASAAAADETLAEISDALAFGEVNEAFHRSQDGLGLALTARNRAKTEDYDALILEQANDVWVHADAPPESAYLDTLAAYYGTGVHQAEFDSEPELVRAAINTDISDTTRGLIPELLGEDAITARTVLVLTNALYFKAPWTHPMGTPGSADFHRLDGSIASIPYLRNTDSLAYRAGEDYVSVAVPYAGGELELLLVVPELGAYETVRQQLSASFVDELVAARTPTYVQLDLPKFTIKSDLPAKEVLGELGIEKLFAPGAELPGLPMPPDLATPYVSDILHQATIAIDEKGTEASAATAVIFAGTSSAPPEPVPVIVDRPFFMAVRDIPTGALLFLGQVVEP
jgi:serpin B